MSGHFFFSLHPTLSIVLAISFEHLLASDLALYHTYVFYHHHGTIEEDLENERKTKNEASPQTWNFHVPRQMCSTHRKWASKSSGQMLYPTHYGPILLCPLLNRVPYAWINCHKSFPGVGIEKKHCLTCLGRSSPKVEFVRSCEISHKLHES